MVACPFGIEKVTRMSRAATVDRCNKTHARRVCAGLKKAYPEATCALTHANPYQLLVATILSAQCTDARVNMVTPELFRRFPDPASLAAAVPGELEVADPFDGFFSCQGSQPAGDGQSGGQPSRW